MIEKKIPYWKQLQDPRWQKMRLKVLERAGFACECCADDTMKLDVHHRFYKKGFFAWDYPESSLVAVCSNCHEAIADYEGNLLCSIDPHDLCNVLDLAIEIYQMRKRGVGLKKLVTAAREINSIQI